MAEYAFTFGARPCLIKTYVQLEVGGDQGFIAFTFVMENNGRSLRPIGDREGRALSFFAQTEAGVVAQASDGLARRFGPRTGVPDCQKNVAAIRHVRVPALLDDQRASLTVFARDTISAGDYVVVTDKGATPLKQTKWPGSGAVLGRALERIRAGTRGQVRQVSPKASSAPAPINSSETAPWAWTALQRYTGWLGHDRSSNQMRAAIAALGVVLDEQGDSDSMAAAIAKVSAEIERLHAVDLRQLFRNALRDLSVGLDSPDGNR
jgi:hypothetical protein